MLKEGGLRVGGRGGLGRRWGLRGRRDAILKVAGRRGEADDGVGGAQDSGLRSLVHE